VQLETNRSVRQKENTLKQQKLSKYALDNRIIRAETVEFHITEVVIIKLPAYNTRPMLVTYFKVCGCVLETRVIRGIQTVKLNIHGSYAFKR